MFLIRTVFWVALLILLLPIGGKNAGNMYGATKHAFNGMDQFCNRNVDICNISQEAWKSLKYKAAYSFETLSSMARQIKAQGTQSYSPVYRSKPENWQPGLNRQAADYKAGNRDYGQNTLRGDDLKPKWSYETERSYKRPTS